MPPPESQPVVLTSRVPADARGETLLTFLTRRFRYHDVEAWREELRAGRLQLDGARADGSEQLQRGMVLRYEKDHREPEVDRGYRVLHEDERLLVVDKPAHLPMHADGPFLRNTLIYLLRAAYGPELQLVHRLDRETSGVCVVARDKEAQALVQAQFGGALAKTYVAVVNGVVDAPFVCDEPIGHDPESEVRLRRSAAPGALQPRPAHTAFAPLAHGPSRTLVTCRPTTGRTHQIRAHLEHRGHPIVGDKLYGAPDARYLDFVRHVKAGGSAFEERGGDPNRQLLHASALSFRHPGDGELVTYEAPTPEEFGRWLLS
jgi:23S rRNA pseudouridine1911/1915/1917 synthase